MSPWDARKTIDELIVLERERGYACRFVRPPDAMRAKPGCRACGQNRENFGYGLCLLTRRFEESKTLLFTVVTFCKECVESEDKRIAVANVIFEAN